MKENKRLQGKGIKIAQWKRIKDNSEWEYKSTMKENKSEKWIGIKTVKNNKTTMKKNKGIYWKRIKDYSERESK